MNVVKGEGRCVRVYHSWNHQLAFCFYVLQFDGFAQDHYDTQIDKVRNHQQ